MDGAGQNFNLSGTFRLKMQHVHLGKGKIEFLSTHNLFCRNFAASSPQFASRRTPLLKKGGSSTQKILTVSVIPPIAPPTRGSGVMGLKNRRDRKLQFFGRPLQIYDRRGDFTVALKSSSEWEFSSQPQICCIFLQKFF